MVKGTVAIKPIELIELEAEVERANRRREENRVREIVKEEIKNTSRQYVDAMDEAVEALETIKRITENPPNWCEGYTLIDATKRAIEFSEREKKHIAAAIFRHELHRLENEK